MCRVVATPRSDNRDAFLLGGARHAEFSALTGLNDTGFSCDAARSESLRVSEKGIELTPGLIEYIVGPSRLNMVGLPPYAIITGNSEQRYLRIYFVRDYDFMFRAIVNDELIDVDDGGVGVLNQFLGALPVEINLLKLSNFIAEKQDRAERGRIEIIGHWNMRRHNGTAKETLHEMQTNFRSIVEGLEIRDIRGGRHKKALTVVDFTSPAAMYPRVFISYSTREAAEKLKHLVSCLLDKNFQPVLGTDFGYLPPDSKRSNQMRVTPDVMTTAFSAMRGCVALISLQVKRSDFCIKTGKTTVRYLVPPWAVAEEVYAWAKGIGMLLRVKHVEIEDPGYNKNIHEEVFDSDSDFIEAVHKVIARLENFTRSPDFPRILEEAKRDLYDPI